MAFGREGRGVDRGGGENEGEDRDSAKGKKMKKIARFLFDTWYGALAACAVSATGVLAGMVFLFWRAGQIAALVFLALRLGMGLTQCHLVRPNMRVKGIEVKMRRS